MSHIHFIHTVAFVCAGCWLCCVRLLLFVLRVVVGASHLDIYIPSREHERTSYSYYTRSYNAGTSHLQFIFHADNILCR